MTDYWIGICPDCGGDVLFEDGETTGCEHCQSEQEEYTSALNEDAVLSDLKAHEETGKWPE